MERAISPTPSSSLDAGRPSAANPHRSLVAERRASYRLFPIVDPTPPASPVTLQKATISKAAGTHRRRSSSLDHHHNVAKERQPSAAGGHATSWTSALRFRDSSNTSTSSRKASLPDILPLRAVKASSGEVAAKLQTLPPRPHTAVDRALEGNVDGRANSITAPSSLGDCNVPSRLEQDGGISSAAVTGLGSNFRLTPAARPGRRVRSRPNLRITVSADHHEDEQPPPPPPKSPRHAREGSDQSQQQTTLERRHATHVRDDSDPPNTPAIAQQQAIVSLSPTLKIRELTVSPARGRAVRKDTPRKMHELLPSDFLMEEEKPLPPVIGSTLQPPASKYSESSVRAATSGGSNDGSSSWRGDSVPPPQRQPPPTPTELQPVEQSSSRWSRMMKSSSRSKSTQDLKARPISPDVRPLASHPMKGDWNDLSTFASRPSQRAVTPDPQMIRSDDADSPRPTAPRTHVHLKSQTSLSGEAIPDYMQPDALSKASLALAAARANVAALRTSNASAGSPASDRGSRSSGSDVGSLSRHPSDGLPRRPTSPGATDPVETLKDLSEQVEALHIRYASLKAERQKISTSIIASLKQQTFTPESASLILDEQLSLAAVSSSIDICFAKLKSLECRKEDAIAALIARNTQAQKSPTDNISAMIASMALTRKTSLASSIDSGSRFVPTGRSTPDMTDAASANRLTQASTRTYSYGSEPESLEHRFSGLSRKHSNGGDSIMYADGIERQTPATIPEDSESPRSQRVSRIHDAASVLDQRTSDVSALSPVLENHPRRSLSEAALQSVDDQEQDEVALGSSSGTLEATPRDPSPTSERSMSPDDLLDERPRRIRVNGSKAAKILGILEQPSATSKDSPPIELPDEKKAPVMVSEIEVELHDSSKLDGTNASLLSVYTKDTEDSTFTTDTQASSEPQALEDQLKSFPRPNSNTLSTQSLSTDGRRDTGGSFLTNGSSAESSCEPDEPEPPAPLNTTRPGRGQDLPSTKSRGEMRKRDPSAHTIQVYLEHDEILDYYNRMRR